MTFSIIGTGNIAWFLGTRLVTGRHRCTGVYSRNTDAARQLAEALLSDKYGSLSDIRDEEADICFIAVADAAIPEVAARISFKHTVLVHTAGAVDINAIADAATDRAILWPVYSILRHNLPDHRNIPCGWEASTDKAQRYMLSMAHAVTDVVFEARYDQRKWLHLAAVIGNNFTNHLVAICEQICADNKVPFTALQPIIHQTFDRLKQSPAQSLQTGPAIRHDSSTINRQVELLGDHPEWQQIYEAITASIQSAAPKQ